MSPRSRRRRSGPAAALAAAAALWAGTAAPAQAVSVQAGQGVVSAVLSYQQGADSFGNPTYSGLQLRIARAGTTVYAQPVESRYCPGACIPEGLGGPPASAPLQVVDLEATGEPTVVLHLYTGGEHCCQVLQIFFYDPATGSYRLAERDFGDAADLVADVAGDRRLEIESADDRFAYRFTSYAFSGLPLQIWRFQGGRLVDATRAFPAALAADAARQRAAFLANRRKGLGLGFIAAWTADEALLGRRRAAERRLRAEAGLHRLRSADRLSPTGSAFIRRLNRFLLRNGYG
jgi:hypothetical protein